MTPSVWHLIGNFVQLGDGQGVDVRPDGDAPVRFGSFQDTHHIVPTNDLAGDAGLFQLLPDAPDGAVLLQRELGVLVKLPAQADDIFFKFCGTLFKIHGDAPPLTVRMVRMYGLGPL